MGICIRNTLLQIGDRPKPPAMPISLRSPPNNNSVQKYTERLLLPAPFPYPGEF
ncbi:hypothetical protein [Microcoleus sp. LAD1_D3]|uniref:hypothetical protein n=1 Tax=Microcoleus sp. LAD1_D3 TaxID=2819365 RepID=UPI002FD3195D